MMNFIKAFIHSSSIIKAIIGPLDVQRATENKPLHCAILNVTGVISLSFALTPSVGVCMYVYGRRVSNNTISLHQPVSSCCCYSNGLLSWQLHQMGDEGKKDTHKKIKAEIWSIFSLNDKGTMTLVISVSLLLYQHKYQLVPHGANSKDSAHLVV